MALDLDALIKQAEADDRAVSKPVMPSSTGTRRPVTITIGTERQPLPGYVIEDCLPIRLIHDYRLQNLLVTHSAQLLPVGQDAFAIKSVFIYTKQDPHLDVAFFGTLLKTVDGYSGKVVVSRPGYESPQTWIVEYDD